MAELMLINPRKRRRKRKMSAKQMMYFGKKRRRRRPVAKRRRYRANPVGLSMANPRRRTHRKRYRRNPVSFRPMTFVNQTLMPSAIGAAGALGLDFLMGFIPLPMMLQGPAIRPFVRIAGAVGIGVLAGMITNRRMGEQVGAGALTVVLYDTLKGFAKTSFPALNLGDLENQDYPMMEYISPAPQVEDLSAYVGTDYSPVGEYVSDF